LGLPEIDECHQDLRKIVQRISSICMSGQFLALKKELETLYCHSSNEHTAAEVFQDALYAIIAQEEMDLHTIQI
jgi:hypothetical protein